MKANNAIEGELTLRNWRGILMSMIMIVMSIWILIHWIVVTFQDISVRRWRRQCMISLKIWLISIVMRFDLLLMLIINLTVFLEISVGFPVLRSEKKCAIRWNTYERSCKRKMRKWKNVNFRVWFNTLDWSNVLYTHTQKRVEKNI